jgi:hypothetical protein
MDQHLICNIAPLEDLSSIPRPAMIHLKPLKPPMATLVNIVDLYKDLQDIKAMAHLHLQAGDRILHHPLVKL